MRLLVLNPNTSVAVTQLLLEQLRDGLTPRPAERAQPNEPAAAASSATSSITLQAVTASLGARYIADEASYAIAAHGTLDAWARHLAGLSRDGHADADDGQPDAVLVGCFGDPGVDALREVSQRPVVGLAEAAMREAAALGPYAIVTGGHAWAPMLWRLARALQLDSQLLAIETVALSGPELSADPQAGLRALRQACVACEHAATNGGVRRARAHGDTHPIDASAASPLRSIIVGGAALGGFAAQLQPLLPWHLIDSVAAGGRALLAAGLAAVAARSTGPAGSVTAPAHAAPAIWQGLSPDLHRRLPAQAAHSPPR